MKRITGPLYLNDHGDGVTVLHEALEALGFPVGDQEREERRYGALTARAIRRFKHRQQLDDLDPNRFGPEAVDRINRLLSERGLLDEPDAGMSVSGRIALADGAGAGGHEVSSFDRGLGREQQLAETTSDADGSYSMTYGPERLLDPERGRADLVVRVLSASGEILVESPLIIDALPDETVNIVIGDESYRGPALFMRLDRTLRPHLDDVDLTRLEPRDLFSLANAASTRVELVHHYVTAQEWTSIWSDPPAEVFFAWFQKGLTPSWSALIGATTDDLARRLEAAAADNTVSRNALAYLDQLETAFTRWRSETIVTPGDRPVGDGELGPLLEITELNPEQRQALVTEWQTFRGEAADFWKGQRERLGDALGRDLDLTLELGFLTRNHTPLVKALKEREDISHLRDVARLGVDDWLRLLDESAIDAPPDIDGADKADRRRAYADAMVRLTEEVLPTAVLDRALAGDPEVDSGNIERFFADQPDAELRSQSIRQFLDEHPQALADFDDPDAVRRELEALQRVFHLSPTDNRSGVAKTLWKNNLHTSWAITLGGEENLIQLFDGDVSLAKRVYQQARSTQQVSHAAALHYYDSKYALGNILPKPQPQIDGIPDLESLFGSQGYCECAHCQSFFSPSAYLVDLFLYLQRAKLTSSSSTPSINTALGLLFDRRPDLANIELDCDNTDTPLPYIDLVNEILENTVSPRSFDTQAIVIGGRLVQMPVATQNEPVPQTEGDPATLEAFPQHQNPAAYEILRVGDNGQGLVYPWNLPFNVWAVEAREILGHLGVPRWRLMASPLGAGDPTEVATEVLGLTPQERDILIDASPSNDRLAEYWGLTGPLQQLDEAEVFLAQSGMSFERLRQLLDIRFIQTAGQGDPVALRYEPASSCRLADARIDNLDAIRLSRIHRFFRLLDRVGGSVDELDRTVMLLGGEIDAAFLEDLADIHRIEAAVRRKTGRAEILSWWAPLDTHDSSTVPSPYRSLFLNPSLSKPVEAELELNEEGTELLKAANGPATVIDLENPVFDPDLQAHLLAALRWTLPELKAVVAAHFGGAELTINLANLSYLVRVSTFCRAMKLRVGEYLSLEAAAGSTPVLGPGQAPDPVRPADTLGFIEQSSRERGLGLDGETLDFLLRHRSRPDSPVALDLVEAAEILVQLRLTLNTLLNEAEPDGASTQEIVKLGVSRILPPDEAVTALSLIGDDPNLVLDAQERKAFIDDTLRFFPDAGDAKAQLVDGGLTDQDDRFAYTADALEPYLVENAAIHYLAEAFDFDVTTAEALLREVLGHPAAPGQPAIRVFFDTDYLESQGTGASLVDTVPDQSDTVFRLHTIAVLLDRTALDLDAVRFLVTDGTAVGLPDITTLPQSEEDGPVSTDTAARWRRLFDLLRIGDAFFPESTTPFDLLRAASESPQTREELLGGLATATGWDSGDITHVAGPAGLDLQHPADFESVDWIIHIADVVPLVARIGVAAQQVGQWTTSEVTEPQAIAIRHALKAKYGPERWLEVASRLRDRVREQQREALLSFVIRHRTKTDQSAFDDVDDVYAHFLVDPLTSACARTSRTVLAISSVQLFIQRILINLEPGVIFNRFQNEQWKWRKQYRVWEANRKVLLWPENWIEPELRDDKSLFFSELEGELLQDELNDATAERAYISYLHKLHDVAHLTVAGVHWEADDRTLHVFAHSAGNPPRFYYRRWENRRDWTAWERVELDIYNSQGGEGPHDGVLLLPVIHNRRLFLFWPIFKPVHLKPTDDDRSAIAWLEFEVDLTEAQIEVLEAQLPGTDTSSEIAGKKTHIREIEAIIRKIEAGHDIYEVTMAYSEYRQGGWIAKRVTSRPIRTPYFEENFASGAKIKNYFFIPDIDDETNVLTIKCYFARSTTYYRLKSTFTYDSCRDELLARPKGGSIKSSKKLPDYISYMKAKDDAPGSKVPLRVVNRSGEVDLLLDAAKNGHLLASSLDAGVFRHPNPFVYEDAHRSFVVIPPQPERFITAAAGRLASKVMAGKTGMSTSSAFEPALVVEQAEPQAASRIETAISRSATSGFFGAAEAGRVVVRSGGGGASSLDSIAAGFDPGEFAASASATDVGISKGIHSPGIRYVREGDYIFRSFYHPYACLFLEQLHRYGIDGLLDPDPSTDGGRVLDRQLTPDHQDVFDFIAEYDPNFDEVKRTNAIPHEVITFNHDDPYALYNWEVFFHIPLLIATRLSQNRKFEAAQRWFHGIFNPTETVGDAPARFWRIKPFHTYGPSQIAADLERLIKGERKAEINAWQEDPFNPHLLARFRRVAYMKTTVMKYLDNLIAWADQLFRQDTIETLNEATQLYVLAGQILGKLPTETESKQTRARTFSELAAELDSLGNGWVEIEQSQNGSANTGSSGGVGSPGAPDLIPYFCSPPNEKLLAYWDVVADRLYKIRHCMNIEGMVRELPLFQPPIDPAMLVRARAAGMDLTSALNDLYAPLPKYRFAVMIRKAQEICREAQSLASALLPLLEKRDAERLAMLRTSHEVELHKAGQEIRAKRITELGHNLEALNQQRVLAEIRYESYSEREFMNLNEILAFGLARGAGVTQAVAVGLAAGGGAAHMAPDVEVGALAGPMGGALNSNRVSGGDKVGSGITAASKWLEMASIILKDLAEQTSVIGGYERRQEDWDLQADLADQEMKQIDQHILAAQLQLAIAEKDQANLEMQIGQAEAVSDMMRNKYTNEALYGWMLGQVSSVYFQTYQLAYDIAKQAEKAFRFELGLDGSKSYIQFGYWDNMRKGLLAGDKLSLDLKRLETAYLEADRRELELEKHVSLRQLDPVALLRLRTEGSCLVDIPEWLFDLDSPGHYNRRLKSVALSLPAVSGPYTATRVTLTLIRSSIRHQSTLRSGEYIRNPVGDDGRFVDYLSATESIVTSHARNDSGLFETNPRDERFLPFEGHGAISTWRLELPTDFRTFDYDTISDVILHFRYTARQTGGELKNKAIENLYTLVGDPTSSTLVQLLSLSHDFPAEWHRFVTGSADFAATIDRRHFPYLVQSFDIEVASIDRYSEVDGAITSETVENVSPQDISDALNDHQGYELSMPEDGLLARDSQVMVFLAIRYALAKP